MYTKLAGTNYEVKKSKNGNFILRHNSTHGARLTVKSEVAQALIKWLITNDEKCKLASQGIE